MASGPRYVVKFRRRRQKRTNYTKRLRLLKSGIPRLVVRKSNTKFIAQVISYDSSGDRTAVNCVSTELLKYGWKSSVKNRTAAYLTGYLTAKKTADSKIKNVVVDLGLYSLTKGNKLFAFLRGVRDFNSVLFSCDESVFPSDEHLFNVSGKDISKEIELVKSKIDGGKK